MKIQYFQNPQLDGKSFFFPGGETGILLIHGFTATTVEVRALGEFLNKHGFTVSAPLLPGHGVSPEDLLNITWRDWVESVEIAYSDLKKRCRRIVVGGESLGGLLSIYLAHQHPEIEKSVLFAPALKIKKIWLSRWLSPFIKIKPKGYGGTDIDGHLPWQGYNVIVVPAANQLRKFQGIIRKILPNVSQPLLIFQGKYDHTVDPISSQIVYELAGAAQKKLVWMHQSGHTLLLDIERDSIFQQTLAFLNKGSG